MESEETQSYHHSKAQRDKERERLLEPREERVMEHRPP